MVNFQINGVSVVDFGFSLKSMTLTPLIYKAQPLIQAPCGVVRKCRKPNGLFIMSIQKLLKDFSADTPAVQERRQLDILNVYALIVVFHAQIANSSPIHDHHGDGVRIEVLAKFSRNPSAPMATE
jgi:hypothetical protein